MLSNLQRLFSPPIFEDVEKNRIASLLNTILWAIILMGLLYTIAAPFLLGQYFSAILTGTLVVVGVIAHQLMVRGYINAASIIILAVMDLILVLSIFVSGGVLGASFNSLVLTTVMAGVLLRGRGAFVMTGINTTIGIVFLVYQEKLPSPLIPQTPFTFFSSLLVYLFFIAALLQGSSRSIEKVLRNLYKSEQEVKQKNMEMQTFASSLETTISSRTRELEEANKGNERRARQFEAITKIARTINQSQDLDTLLSQLTELISQQFGYYHIGVFFLDYTSGNAVLIASNSPGGKKMLARNHKLKIGQTGIVGYVAGTGLPRIALDTGADAIYFNNPDLPETRSEIALPLTRRGNEVIGVLDVQSMEQNAFNQEDIRTLSTLADQVAIAIQNAQLFAEQERILRETQAIYSRDFKSGWARFMRTQNISGINRRNMRNTLLAAPMEIPGAMEAIRSGRVYQSNINSPSMLTIPIKLRERTLGVLHIKSEDNQTWTEDEMDIISAIMERAALSIENARLLEDSRLIAEREHAISDISTKIGSDTQIEQILKTVARELGAQLSGTQITVEIGGGDI